MRSVSRGLAAAVLGLALVAGATACSSDSAGSAAVSTVAPADAAALIDDGATVIDVRTPAEFAAGHVPGAVNLNVESPDFAAGIAELATDATYVVYCRSGRRSALAADQMAEAGFTTVRDLGALDSWAAAGYPVVS
jgi:rhodanese-related sulfurtransferase